MRYPYYISFTDHFIHSFMYLLKMTFSQEESWESVVLSARNPTCLFVGETSKDSSEKNEENVIHRSYLHSFLQDAEYREYKWRSKYMYS